MADKFINETGLQAIKTWANGKYATNEALNTLDDKVDEVIAEGGEPNVIETVKVNGTALTPDAQKAVNVRTPYTDTGEDGETGGTYYSMTDNDGNTFYRFVTSANGYKVGLGTGQGGGGITKELVDKNYVDANGGKIDKIKVNGTEQTITNKEVDITVPTKTSDITNDSNFQNETQVQAQIDAKLTSVYKPGGTVEFASLPPLVKENVGYIYDVMDGFTTTADFVEGAGKTYPAHTNVGIIDKGPAGYFYDVFSGMVDLSGYWSSTTGQSNTLVAMTVEEINAILNA